MTYDFQFAFIFQHMDQLLWGALLTIRLSALAMIFGLAVGIFGAIVSIHGSRPARFVVTTYVEVIRSTPFLVQLFIIFFGLPLRRAGRCQYCRAGGNDSQPRSLFHGNRAGRHDGGASVADRSCPGAGDDALAGDPACGVDTGAGKVYPALASQFTLMMLASSVVSAISAEELTAAANLLDAETFRSFEIYLIVMALYILLALLFRLSFWIIGLFVFKRRRRLGVARPRGMK